MASLLENDLDCAISFCISGRRPRIVPVWIATRHEDLDTVFLKIDSLIEGHITEIKTTLEYSRLKEKDNDNSNPIIAQLCYNVSHLALRIIKDEIKRALKILSDPENLCGHWIIMSHMLPCSCKLLK
ncbi:hypothetical protein M9H77_18531 [Catharanthus roseus]|uniref:Uncharacterized protein n=1 Tax=Catharanthus roseus TaxID=4058 RepID=A0ACC0B7Z5_CATRO|nr:hypothetical protein M9H77_18531 [Catharanthus roseus]